VKDIGPMTCDDAFQPGDLGKHLRPLASQSGYDKRLGHAGIVPSSGGAVVAGLGAFAT
jgi:hypothetical protein